MKNKQIICYIFIFLFQFHTAEEQSSLCYGCKYRIPKGNLSLQNKKYYSKCFNKELVLLYWVPLHYPYNINICFSQLILQLLQLQHITGIPK